ncbi:MAG: hypothetical protein UU48_C0004G0026 [Candidatus Uhrbacteria bacterium GW2011_GWF2_41_16]|jgi:hypothetical protein|uniref:Uncharacterized protein n=2 Tax=Candidatus Uhriibacteriota TaxID=1752732 RepID=A0A0G0VBE0_9BACT|nr:MAG: hypothetical protein UU35_C0010G0001 [Candidatus Uhrbacteria bacterium GW2011_GWC2_41_11]KKR98233.1 MAG: hypothetical protein UU48_C0004G0026 [Candidatus Uhrbacteria bacterium GW2011_GWF2_41_16]HBP00008.1 hypothetical protein [Candidatus Uhrbacteria bacterium]
MEHQKSHSSLESTNKSEQEKKEQEIRDVMQDILANANSKKEAENQIQVELRKKGYSVLGPMLIWDETTKFRSALVTVRSHPGNGFQIEATYQAYK